MRTGINQAARDAWTYVGDEDEESDFYDAYPIAPVTTAEPEYLTTTFADVDTDIMGGGGGFDNDDEGEGWSVGGVLGGVAEFVLGEAIELLTPWDHPGTLVDLDDENVYEGPEPYGGYVSEVAGAIVGGAVGALATPAVGVAAGLATELLVENLFQGPVQEPTPGYFGGGGGYSDVFPGGTDMTMAVPQLQFAYVKTNPMTGLKYGRLMDGRMVYQRKNGTIKLYRPKKPIVLMPGSITLSQAARASTQLGNLAKKMKKSKFKAFL